MCGQRGLGIQEASLLWCVRVCQTNVLGFVRPVCYNLSGRDPCTGEDLLVASADKPFRFPATFTFVVRSFTVLDGIGKGLDPRFDISEIAAPYARGLLLEGNPQYAALAKDFRRRVGLQVTHACTLKLKV